MQADTISSRGNHSSIRHVSIAAAVAALAMLASSGDHRGAVLAQASPPAGIVANGNAVVTGFSGAQPPAITAPGVDPADKTFIDLQGPAAVVAGASLKSRC